MPNNDYEDIINLPHYQSTKRVHMSNYDRAAQFSPFAALTGYDDAVKEMARLTNSKIDLDEDSLAKLNDRLNQIQDKLEGQPKVSITYFVSDKKKAGGSYQTTSGIVKRIDEYERVILMQDGAKILIDDILDLQSDFFHL